MSAEMYIHDVQGFATLETEARLILREETLFNSSTSDVSRSGITQTGLTVAVFTLLAVSAVGAIGRVGARLYWLRAFELDDFFLLISLFTSIASGGLVQHVNGSVFASASDSTGGDTDFSLDFRILRFTLAINTLQWIAIYSAKISILIFFKKLVKCVHKLETWWAVAISLVSLMAVPSILSALIVCTDFTDTAIKTCPPDVIVGRGVIFAIVTGVLDISSDLLVLSIPCALIYMVKMQLRRKLMLASVTCLSIFMIIIVIIRLAARQLQDGQRARAWIFFWQQLEVALAIIAVSITGFRSIYAIESKRAKERIPSRDGK